MSDYEALKRHGFSPAKAAKIVLDAKRGMKIAQIVIHVARETIARAERK